MWFTVVIPLSTWQLIPLLVSEKIKTALVPANFLEPSIGELRYIARLNSDLLPNEEPFGDVSNTADGSVVEGSDVVSKTLAFRLGFRDTNSCSSWLTVKLEASSTQASDSSMIRDTVSTYRFLPKTSLTLKRHCW